MKRDLLRRVSKITPIGAFLVCMCFAAAAASNEQPAALMTVDEIASAQIETPKELSARHALGIDPTQLLTQDQLDAVLVNGHRYHFQTVEREIRSEGRFVWRGEVVTGDGQHGSATLTVDGERVRGRIHIGRDYYQVRPDGQGGHWLDVPDAAEKPSTHPEGGPLVPPVKPAPLADLRAPTDHDPEPVIDIIVFYTESAIGMGGGYVDEADLRLAIQGAVDATNTAYINSDVDGRLRLMGMFRSVYVESGDMGDDLENFTDNNFYGANPEVAEMEELYSSDLAALIVDDTGFCGVGWLLTEYTDDWSDWGYSVTSGHQQCLGGQTFAHEVGHNVGLHHDPENQFPNDPPDPDALIEPFAYGHFVEGEFRTIMSYSTECTVCPRIDHFSDPDINASGHPTGLSDRNNAEVLRSSLPYVEHWGEPPATLAEALGDPSGEYRTGGDGRWVAQDVVTYNGGPAVVSGPVHGTETAWLELEHESTDALEVSFQARARESNPEGFLELRADGNLLDTIDDLDADWSSYTVNIPSAADDLRWVWNADPGAEAADVGQVLIADVERDDLAESTYFGTVLNVEGEPVADVDVRALDDDGNTMGSSTTTAGDGSFELTVEHPEGNEPSDLELSGEGIQESEHAAAGCEEEANPCSLTATGVAREIAGQVSGMLAGESVTVDAGLGAEGTFTSDVSGVADFTLSADSLLSYGPLDVEADGYEVTSAEISSIDVRAEDATGLSVTLGTEPPVIHVVDVVDATESGFTVEVTFDAFNRDATAILSYGEGEDEVVDEQTVVGTTDGHLLTFEVSGMDCGSSQDFELEVVNDHDQHDLVAASGDSAECSDSGSSGCTLGSGARMDPLFGLLMLLALGGLLRRKAVNRSAES